MRRGQPTRQRYTSAQVPVLRKRIAHMRDVDRLTFRVIGERVELSAAAVMGHYRESKADRTRDIYA